MKIGVLRQTNGEDNLLIEKDLRQKKWLSCLQRSCVLILLKHNSRLNESM